MSDEAPAGGGIPTPVILIITFLSTCLLVLILWAVLPRPTPHDGSSGRNYHEDFPDDDGDAGHLDSVERDLGVSDEPGEVPTRIKDRQ